MIDKLDSLVEKDIPEIVSQSDTQTSRVDGKIEQLLFNGTIEKEERTAVDTAKKADANILGMLGRIITFILLLVVFVEGVYYLSFGKPAYSLPELKSGYNVLFDSAKNNPKVSEIRSQITSKIQSTSTSSSVPVSSRTAKGSPLSSLPTKSGVSFKKKATQLLKKPSSSDGKAEL